MSTHHPERRLDRLSRIEYAIEKLAERQSMRKNGESWPQYVFGKVLTVDRVLMGGIIAIQLVFSFGGQVQSARSQLESLVKAREAVVAQQDVLAQQVTIQQQITAAQGTSVDRLMSETTRLSRVVGQLDDQMKQTVKRAELKDAVEGRLIPRLERIEKAVKFD